MSNRWSAGDLRVLAERRHRDPLATLAAARQAQDELDVDDPERAALIGWIEGLALHETGVLDEAVAAYDRAIAIAAGAGLDQIEAQAHASRAASLNGLGDSAAAMTAIDRALALAAGPTLGPVRMIHGVLLQRDGRLDEALDAFEAALPVLEAAGDEPTAARLYLNRGTLHAYRGETAAAREDFGACERLAGRLDLPVLSAMAAHNLGFALARSGDVPGALSALDRAEASYHELGDPDRLVAVLAADRCEVLLAAGLASEARQAAEAGRDALARAGEGGYHTESLLLLARALSAEHRFADATAAANEAAAAFDAGGRRAWAALAHYVAIQAEVLDEEDVGVTPALLARCQAIAGELGDEGWSIEAAHVRTFVGRVALGLGRTDVARAELGTTSPRRAGLTAELQIDAWHATALLRVAEGDRSGARRALRAGLDVVDRHQATLGASELRAQAAARGTELARLGLRLALERGRAADVLWSAERHRAGSLWLPPARPPDDDQLATELSELRRLRAELTEATIAGDGDGMAARRIAAAERAVQASARRFGGGTGGVEHGFDLAALRTASASRVIVELLAVEGELHAVTVRAGRCRLHHVGPIGPVVTEKEHLLSALRRLLGRARQGRPLDPALRARDQAAVRLDQLLFGPLGLPPDEPLVLVPTQVAHGLPWSALPTVASRPTVVAPSAALWQRPDTSVRARRRRRSRASLTAGPGLDGAAGEVRALADVYPDSTVLVGSTATTAAVMDALERADVAHLAAHGAFRADNPQFSSLELGDGPLTVFDLEGLRSCPRVVVLPACSAAVLDVRAGDEVIGTTAALLRVGARAIVAPVLPVPDGATARFSVGLHERLRDGAATADALRDIAAELRASSDPASLLVADAFVCLGADDPPEPSSSALAAAASVSE